jgi:hypothetical protein
MRAIRFLPSAHAALAPAAALAAARDTRRDGAIRSASAMPATQAPSP